MSAKSIQRKLNKAYGKVAKKLGFDCDIYRISQNYDTPISDANWLYNTKGSFSQNSSYNAPVGSNTWIAWIDGTLDNKFDLKEGDIVVDRETGLIYYMIDMHPLHPFRALQANNFVTIESNVEYDTHNGEWGQGTTTILKNIPAWVGNSASRAIDNGFVPGRSIIPSSSAVYDIQLWMPEGMIRPNDIITANGNRLQAISVVWDIRGYKITAVEVYDG